MKKTKIIFTIILLCTILSTSINVSGAEKKDKVSDTLSIIKDALTDIYNIVTGIKTDTEELRTSSDETQTSIDEMQTSLNGIESDLEGLNIAVPEQIPVYLSQEFTLPNDGWEPYAIAIRGDNIFELKAVYVSYDDPDDEVNLRFIGATVSDDVHPSHEYYLKMYTNILPKMPYAGYELLTYFDLPVNPTIDVDSLITFQFEFDEPELLDWDEELHVKIMFSAPTGTSLNCYYFYTL